MKIIEEELGSPVESFFRYISNEPVAAASFGQVALYATICISTYMHICMYIHLEIF